MISSHAQAANIGGCEKGQVINFTVVGDGTFASMVDPATCKQVLDTNNLLVVQPLFQPHFGAR